MSRACADSGPSRASTSAHASFARPARLIAPPDRRALVAASSTRTQREAIGKRPFVVSSVASRGRGACCKLRRARSRVFGLTQSTPSRLAATVQPLSPEPPDQQHHEGQNPAVLRGPQEQPHGPKGEDDGQDELLGRAMPCRAMLQRSGAPLCGRPRRLRQPRPVQLHRPGKTLGPNAHAALHGQANDQGVALPASRVSLPGAPSLACRACG